MCRAPRVDLFIGANVPLNHSAEETANGVTGSMIHMQVFEILDFAIGRVVRESLVTRFNQETPRQRGGVSPKDLKVQLKQ